MSSPTAPTEFEITCPHCKKPFVGEPLGGESASRRGFKCPHCRLFVPWGRADEQEPLEEA